MIAGILKKPAYFFMEKFVDLHNHIIYDFDDGPESLELSLEMLKAAADQNIGVIYATSHFDEYTPEAKLTEYYQKLDVLKEQVQKLNLDLELRAGAEIYYHSYMVDSIKKYKNYILGETSGFVLFEFPMFQNFSNIDLIFQLRIHKLKPIIAHPERYVAVLSNWKILVDFVKMGGIIQVNAGSVLGHYGSPVQKIALKLLENQLVHLIASDAHNTTSRPFLMEKVYRFCQEHLDADYCHRLFYQIPSRIVHGEAFEPMVPVTKEKDNPIKKIIRNMFHKQK
jgi:protein-tyrosine phosphatase